MNYVNVVEILLIIFPVLTSVLYSHGRVVCFFSLFMQAHNVSIEKIIHYL